MNARAEGGRTSKAVATAVAGLAFVGYFGIARIVGNLYPFSTFPMYAGEHRTTGSRIVAKDAAGALHEVSDGSAYARLLPLDVPRRSPMMTSPYDGYSRAPLRVGLALVGALDAVLVALRVHAIAPSARTHPLAPSALIGLHAHPLTLAGLVVVAFVGFAALATRRAAVAGSIAGIVVLAILEESHAALVGGPMRNFFFSGALTLGWAFGALCARGVSSRTLSTSVAGEERFAELGSVGVLAATYTGAAVSKLLASGAGWLDPNHLRAIVVAQHRVADASILGRMAALVVDHGVVAMALEVATLVVQLGAVLLVVSARSRAAWSVALLGFHLCVALLTGLVYLEAMVLVLLFGFPWPALLRRPRTKDAPLVVVRSPRLVLGMASAALVIVAALAALPPVRSYTSMHHRSNGPSTPPR